MEKTKLKKNDELEVVIDRLGANGEGVAVENGTVIFVPFALPGERVKIHIINDKKSFLIAKLIEVILPSKDRVTSKCPYFTKCGGCDIEHLNYNSQLEFKQKLVQDTIKKYAGINISPLPVIASKNEFRYRNKFAFPVCFNGKETNIGMYQKNSHRVVEIDDCKLQSENAKIILHLFKEYLKENHITGYNEETQKGDIKHIVVRESGNDFILTVVVLDEKFNNFEPLISKLKTKFSNFGVYKNVNKLQNNVIFGNLDIHIYGIKELNKHEFGIDYFVNNRSFLQVNDDIKTKAYNLILSEISGSKNVIDAYSGAGLLSSIIAKTGANVYGVEIVKEATQNAEKLKKINNLNNLTNINGDCAKIIPELAEKLKGDFAVVVDPPRKGLDKTVVDAFLKAQPNKIIYLSCDPATLARDLKILVEKYDIKFVQLLDMFPQTANIETLVSLTLKQNK